jgi:DNA-binding transcriptional LysR family regulator
MELRQLKYFIAIAEELHFGRAAEKMHVTASALSQQIHLLEGELKVDLFNQSKRVNFRRVELTEAGSVFLEEARKTINQSELAIEKARNAHKNELIITFGVFKTILPERVEHMMELFTTHFPDIKIKIVELASSNSVQDALHNDLLDVGLTVLPLKYNTLDKVIYSETYFGILMHKNHSLALQSSIKLDNLTNEKWVDYGKEVNPFYDELEIACKEQGFSRENAIIQIVPSIELLKRWVNSEKGIAFVPVSLDLSKEPNLTIKPMVNAEGLPFQSIVIQSGFVFKMANPMNLVHKLVELVKQRFKIEK